MLYCSDVYDYIDERWGEQDKTLYVSIAHPKLSPLHILTANILTSQLMPPPLQRKREYPAVTDIRNLEGKHKEAAGEFVCVFFKCFAPLLLAPATHSQHMSELIRSLN